MEYSFSQLNDKEFEVLVCDLLSIELDEHIERFKSGKDNGVDGRFFSPAGTEIIIQCKHYYKSELATLLRNLKKEATKVKKLNPQKYLLVTSVPLSRHNKKAIKKIFEPYIKIDSDIYGCEDLNSMLFPARRSFR